MKVIKYKLNRIVDELDWTGLILLKKRRKETEANSIDEYNRLIEIVSAAREILARANYPADNLPMYIPEEVTKICHITEE